MREIEVRERLERLGHRLLSNIDDIVRTTCPRCHLANLGVVPGDNGKTVIMECTTPQVYNEEYRDYDRCDFYVVATGIPTAALPDPIIVAEPEPPVTKLQPRKAPRKRRR